MNTTRRTWLGFATATVAFGTSATFAQSAYPAKPVRVIVPFPAGQGTDVATRYLCEQLGKSLGQNFFVDNRPGASARLGMELLAKAAPDGYTLGVGTAGTHTINPALYPQLGYDPESDFEPITLTGELPLVFAAQPGFAADTIPALVAAARARPDTLNVAVPALPQRIALELLRQLGNAPLFPIPYKGSAQALSDLLGGQVPLIVDSVAALRPHLTAGKVKAIAITSARSGDVLPGVRSVAEQGIAGYEITPWNAFFAPRGTPAPIVLQLESTLQRILASADARQRLGALGIEVAATTSAQLAERARSERKRWAEVIKANNIQAD